MSGESVAGAEAPPLPFGQSGTATAREFVLDCAAYPEALDWVARLVQHEP